MTGRLGGLWMLVPEFHDKLHWNLQIRSYLIIEHDYFNVPIDRMVNRIMFFEASPRHPIRHPPSHDTTRSLLGQPGMPPLPQNATVP